MKKVSQNTDQNLSLRNPLDDLELDPKAIDPNKVKAYSVAHGLTLQQAYAQMLATDLLKRVDIGTADTQTKIVLRILINMVVGEGEKNVVRN